MNTNRLQTEILRAHEEVKRGSPGARRKLDRLQADYRSGRHEIIRGGGTCRLIEHGSTPKPPTTSRRLSERSSRRPYWMLGPEPEPWRL
jgi:hypothetical protein